jgi:hypothetical protein
VNRWPTEETVLGPFFDVTNPMKVGGADPNATGQPARAREPDIANFSSG